MASAARCIDTSPDVSQRVRPSGRWSIEALAPWRLPSFHGRLAPISPAALDRARLCERAGGGSQRSARPAFPPHRFEGYGAGVTLGASLGTETRAERRILDSCAPREFPRPEGMGLSRRPGRPRADRGSARRRGCLRSGTGPGRCFRSCWQGPRSRAGRAGPPPC